MWIFLVTIVVLAGLAGGLVVWAPWRPPPLLRPTGLTAGPSTTSSVALHWSGPATGPAPDKYVILYGGSVIGSVRGTVTSYRRTGLYPATSYQYQVAAVRGGKRSRPSAAVVLKTVTPPVSAARWQGPWTVHVRIVQGGAGLTGPRRWDDSWQVSPECAAGPCPVQVAGTFNQRDFRATLTRTGAVYAGTTTAHSFRCGKGPGSFPTTSTLKIRVTLTGAQGGSNGAWTAISWTGTLRASAPYTSLGNAYCNAVQVTASLAAVP
ncbi:MAG TPA: fibronectin type III domain-containing protein [Streptosporangiaceae bacterium]